MALQKNIETEGLIIFTKSIPIYIVCILGLFYICNLLNLYDDKNYFTRWVN